MAFEVPRKYRFPGDPPPARAATPQSAHDYQLLATAAACLNLLDTEISELSGLDRDYINRLLRSAAGLAFVRWFYKLPEELQEKFRLKEDFQTPPEEAKPERAERLESPSVLETDDRPDDPLADFLRDADSTEPAPAD